MKSLMLGFSLTGSSSVRKPQLVFVYINNSAFKESVFKVLKIIQGQHMYTPTKKLTLTPKNQIKRDNNDCVI